MSVAVENAASGVVSGPPMLDLDILSKKDILDRIEMGYQEARQGQGVDAQQVFAELRARLA